MKIINWVLLMVKILSKFTFRQKLGEFPQRKSSDLQNIADDFHKVMTF